MASRPAILYIGPSVSWKSFLEAIRSQGFVAVACIAEDFHGGPITAFYPFKELRKPERLKELGFESLIEHREPFRILEQAKTLEDLLSLRFVGVLRASEADTAVIDFVASGLGLPHNLLSTVLARRDKAAMKEALKAAGLAHAAFARIVDVSQVASAVERLGLPVVLKTPSCGSSSDVFVCRSVEVAVQRAEEVLGRKSPWGEQPSYVLLEEYLDGPEYAVNTFADGQGQMVVTDMWSYERKETSRGNVLYSSTCSVDPAQFPEACSYALRVCKAVGITMEAGHVEVKVTKRGPVMVEVGARRPGGQKTEMLAQLVPTWDPFVAQVLTCCRKPPTLPGSFSPVKLVRHCFFHVVTPGVVTAVRGETEIRALKSYHSMSIMAKVGEFAKETTDIVSCAGFVWLVGTCQQQLDADEQMARSCFKVETDVNVHAEEPRAKLQKV
mmetsp:Transcript_123117/g.342913  ORF Transcript_123117/g.342913 Transcript_123117/m.342913 type:complete len:441 (-) Transcript_123117:99-1421(-)